jgi:hypothetical protein
MQEKAIVYFVVAWLGCWLVDLIFITARTPLPDPIVKLVIVAICLILVLIAMSKANWLL